MLLRAPRTTNDTADVLDHRRRDDEEVENLFEIVRAGGETRVERPSAARGKAVVER
jgi:hypothetical protein